MIGADLVIGIDPGLGGYISVLNINTFEVEFHALPVTYYLKTYTAKTGEIKTRRCREINSLALLELVRRLSSPRVAFVALEHQQSYPGRQGSSSTGKIIRIYSLLEAMFMSTNMSLEIVKPVVWKRALGLVAPRRKKAQTKEMEETIFRKKCRAWELCVNLFPELRHLLMPKSYSFDKAESLLIAYWGLQVLGKKYGLSI